MADRLTTIDLYAADPYLKEFEARVTGCSERKEGWEITLDSTAFYPEGGGQPGDTGILRLKQSSGETAEIRVIDTRVREGKILHTTKQPLEIGTQVHGVIDWERRFDLMQNHTGEHMVSGLIHQHYGLQNVGFHMGKDMITIDLNGELTMEQLSEIEAEANRLIWEDLPVEIREYPEEEAEKLTYRSKKELHGQVRIVTIPKADVCACCGTHVSSTGQIGLIKLLSAVRFRGGVRIEMLCGRRAYEYLAVIWRENHDISVELSAKPLETAAAVRRLKAQENEASFRLEGLLREQFKKTAASLRGSGNILLFEEGLQPEGVRQLAAAVIEECTGICCVCSGDDASGYKYAIGQKDGDLRKLVKEMNAALQGRGGGKPFFAQGSLSAGKEQIEGYFREKGILC